MLTASTDKSARLWSSATGQCLQVLEGHADEIFSCAFNYEGDTIITGTNAACSLWKRGMLYYMSAVHTYVTVSCHSVLSWYGVSVKVHKGQ